MKTFMIALCVALFATPAFASALRCTLESGQKKDVISVDLEDAKSFKDPTIAQGVYDIGYTLELSCQRVNCRADVTFTSSKLEDDAGQIAFTFRKGQKGRVHGEPLTNAPDRRDYQFYCYVD